MSTFLSNKFVISINFCTFEMSNNNKQIKMKVYKVKEVIKLLEKSGWYQSYCKGDHRQFKHPTISGKVTVRGKPNEDLDQFILNSIWRQAGWK